MKRTKLIGSASSEPRVISDLQSVSLATTSPWKKIKLKGSRAAGKSYERRVGKLIYRLLQEGTLDGELFSGQWLAFYDTNGRGYAQPDYYLRTCASVLVVEVKLKQNSQAHVQLDKLYRPLLERLYSLPVIMLQIFKYPRWEPDDRRIALLDGIQTQFGSKIWEWHWLGD